MIPQVHAPAPPNRTLRPSANSTEATRHNEPSILQEQAVASSGAALGEQQGKEVDMAWPDPLPLVTSSAAPPMPPLLLPEKLRPWLEDEAERMSVPLEMVAVPAVVALSAAAGRNIAIYPKQFDGWQVVPNLWGVVIAPPSSLKSPALQAGVRPLEQIAAETISAHAEGRLLREAQVTIIESQLAKLKKASLGASPPPTLLADIAQQRLALEQAQLPARRFITNDPTVEMAAELLRTNERGLLIVRDELAGLLYACDKQGREGDREFFLEAFNSKDNYTVDRIGRGTLHIPALTLSIIGGIQPGKMDAYVRGAVAGGREADGLLQRFQLAVYPEPPSAYVHVDRPPNLTAREKVQNIFRLLVDLDPTAYSDLETSPGQLPGLRFEPAAQALFDEWYVAHMRRLRSSELAATPAFQAHLGKYQALAAKLALLFHLVTTVESGELGHVSLDALKLALAWVDYLTDHARKIYAAELATLPPSVHELADRVLAGDVFDGMPIREIYRHNWRGLNSPQTTVKALAYLEERHWLRLERSSPKVGRPSQIVRVNPRLRDDIGQTPH